jgi:hypothetical protein
VQITKQITNANILDTMEVLIRVDEYIHAHGQGDVQSKQCWWQLTKARLRSSGSNSTSGLSVENLRPDQEFGATTRVLIVTESDDDETPPLLVSADTNDSSAVADDNAAANAVGCLPMFTLATKQKDELNDGASLVSGLCGGSLPPREMKLTQENAEQMLQHYVEAANVAAQLLQTLRQLQDKELQ